MEEFSELAVAHSNVFCDIFHAKVMRDVFSHVFLGKMDALRIWIVRVGCLFAICVYRTDNKNYVPC